MFDKNKVSRELMRIAKSLQASTDWKVKRSELGRFLDPMKQYKGIGKDYKLDAWYGQYGKYWIYAVYSDKSTYPIRYCTFMSENECVKELKQSIGYMTKRIDEKRKEKEEFSNPYKVGDILYASWGYDQTNINFYKVVKLSGKSSVYIVEISCKVVSSSHGSDSVVPLDKEIGKPFMRRVGTSGDVKVESFIVASKWDGRPKERTSAGWGH